eukprot:scaffold278233_cov37-Tisochrysis_lutea.AAC.2
MPLSTSNPRMRKVRGYYTPPSNVRIVKKPSRHLEQWRGLPHEEGARQLQCERSSQTKSGHMRHPHVHRARHELRPQGPWAAPPLPDAFAKSTGRWTLRASQQSPQCLLRCATDHPRLAVCCRAGACCVATTRETTAPQRMVVVIAR